MVDARRIRWLDEPEAQDYPAAASFLSLIYDQNRAAALVKQLGDAKLVEFKAKDIFRASGLSLLGVSNTHVNNDLDKIRNGKKLSPLLLVRAPEAAKVIVADGYHRMCAVYSLDENAVIPCKIV